MAMLPCIYGYDGPRPSLTPRCRIRLFLLTKGFVAIVCCSVYLLERLGSQAGKYGVCEQAKHQGGSNGWRQPGLYVMASSEAQEGHHTDCENQKSLFVLVIRTQSVKWRD